MSLLARIPITAAPVILTLHVVLDLHQGFAASGLLAAMFAIGAALGAPALGATIDRAGLQPVLVLTTAAEGAFWLTAGHLSYLVLMPASFLCGLLALPVFTVARQSLAALLPPQRRQAGFSLDSMSAEVSFAVGPALGVIALTQFGSTIAFAGVAVLIIASGVALMRLDPPVRGEVGVDPEFGVSRKASRDFRPAVPVTPKVAVRDWFGARVLAVLLATFGATMTLSGTETAFTAAVRGFGTVALLGLVMAIWCLASLVGGFVYGLSSRRIDPLVLLALLAAFTIPLAVAGSWWALALIAIPTGLFCAPLISSTAELLTDITPAPVRGQVMGAHASALTVGNALGAPLVGIIVDQRSAGAGFVGIGVGGFALAIVGLSAQALRRRVQSEARSLAAGEPATV